MQELRAKKIILGVCGGIAAYKAVLLARDLVQLGAEVQVVMTESAQAFIGVQTFQALTSRPVYLHSNDDSFEQAMAHIELGRWADYLLIAPATAQFIAKMAQGLADDLLSLLYLSTQAKVLICPAMNLHMWQHPATQDNLAILSRRGVYIIGPDEGVQACGDQGLGRMREPEWIIHALTLWPIYASLRKQRFVLTAGPTREAIDPVRFISNRSSGLMAYALAEALAFAGAEVCLVSGPTQLACPPGVKRIAVESADEMYQAVQTQLKVEDCFIGVAAVSDFKVVNKQTSKIKKVSADNLTLEFSLGVDILKQVKQRSLAACVIGFAAETEHVLEYARQKLAQKADMIIANQVGKNLGFEQEELAVTVLTAEQEHSLAKTDKLSLAVQLVHIIKEFLEQRNKS